MVHRRRPPKAQRPRFLIWGLLAACLLLSALGWWLSAERSPSRPKALDETTDGPSDQAARPKRQTPPETGHRAVERPGPSAGCQPAAGQRCHQGDVWSVSSCGELEERLDECGDQLCTGDRCDEPGHEACLEPAEGRCDGQVVVMCFAGRTQRIHCAEKGMSCAIGEEGAECVPLIAADERCSGPARCDKNVLLTCEEGRTQKLACAELGAQCLLLPGAREPSCVRAGTPAVGPCGPCGCQADESGETDCDGRDEDQDRRVDEGLDCGPVPVVAFVVTDERGESSYAREDIDAELVRVNEAFGGVDEESTLRFELDQVIEVPDSRLLALADKEIGKLLGDTRVQPVRDEFYVPVLFTDQLLAGGGTPKFGLSTLPNGTCGGMQQRAGPELGLVVVGKARAPTTVAHEIGHFLGLCHTHDTESPLANVALPGLQQGALTACGDMCRAEGDGLCDTPFDPGPELCHYDAACDVLCRGGDQPDPSNLMSYYTSCRRRFSRDQMRLMQHTLALRRAWHACIGGRCQCQLGGTSCPEGMSCRPRSLGNGDSGPRCTLDGPRPPGSNCDDTSHCGQGALCLHETNSQVKRCVRTCLLASETKECDCVSAGNGLSICRDDLLR